MKTRELRTVEEARPYLTQGLWLQRVRPPTAASVQAALEWSLEIAAAGQLLPPIGFVADLGHAAFDLDWDIRATADTLALPHWPGGLARTYEDHVLGKLYADWAFLRAGEALRRYDGRDRARGLAFVLNQLRERAGFGGVELSPTIIKSLLEDPAQDLLADGWEALQRHGLNPLIGELYHDLIDAVRQTAEVLAPEDVFELEHRTALGEFADRLALRQVLQAAERLDNALPQQLLRPRVRRQEVPTRILDEDTYPVGGYSSLANRGSIESMLHSQLAYMEETDRPDLFDIKFLRDELLYYARDENQFLRQRRTFVFALFPDLVQTRFKDAALPYQRGVLLLALLYVAVQRLANWLSTDALHFVFVFVGAEAALAVERKLLAMLLREPIARGMVEIIQRATTAALAAECRERTRRSLCHCVTVSTVDQKLVMEETIVTRLVLDGPCPRLAGAGQAPAPPVTEETLEGWQATLLELLQRWIY